VVRVAAKRAVESDAADPAAVTKSRLCELIIQCSRRVFESKKQPIVTALNLARTSLEKMQDARLAWVITEDNGAKP
jgi:hypothetical protein